MDIIQLIITIAGFIGLFIYQHYKIKTLKDQTTAQSEILNNLKTYSDIIKPEILKYRLEQHEKLTEKEKNFEIKQIQEKLSKEFENITKKYTDKQKQVERLVHDLLISMKLITAALYYLPHIVRQDIVNQIEDNKWRKIYQDILPVYQESDREKWPSIVSALQSGGTESLKQNEK